MLSFLPVRRVLLPLLVSLILAYFLFVCARFYLTKRRHDRLALSLGCKPPKRWRTYDPIFGLDFIYEQYKALRAGNVIEMMANRFTKLGCRTAKFSIVGMTTIGTVEPANIQAVLASDFPSWNLPDQRKHHLIEFLGEGIFTTDGKAWKHSREMIRPSFARNRIEDLQGNLEKHCQRLIDCIRPGEEVDLQPLFFAFTMDVATKFLFGESSDTLVRMREKMEGQAAGEKQTRVPEKCKVAAEIGDVTAEEFVEAFTYAQARAEGVGDEEDGKWIGFIKLFLPNRKTRRCYKIINSYIDSIVARALSSSDSSTLSSKPTFLTTLISQTRSPLKLRAEILNTLLAARDTTASLLSNVWFELSRRPKIWHHLRHDIASTLRSASDSTDQTNTTSNSLLHLPTQPPTYTDLKSLPYLTALLKESLRLFPVVPSNARQAIRDTTLPLGGGADGQSPIFVPKGTMLHWMLWGMHRRQDLFGEDAEEFRVERWLDSNENDGGNEKKGEEEDDNDDGAVDSWLENSTHDNSASNHSLKDVDPTASERSAKRKGLRPTWEFLPFNGGPRICVGQQFALAEAAYVTVRLMQAFSTVEPRGEDVWREKIGLVMTGKGGARCVFRR